MAERERFTERWHGAIRDWPGSLTLAWGLRDPVARTEVLRGLQELRPGVRTIELPDAGHYPQIETPEAIGAASTRRSPRPRAWRITNSGLANGASPVRRWAVAAKARRQARVVFSDCNEVGSPSPLGNAVGPLPTG